MKNKKIVFRIHSILQAFIRQTMALKLIIQWIGVWFYSCQPTLRDVINKAENIDFQNNPTIVAYQYGRLRSFLYWAENNILKAILLVIALYSILAVAFYYIKIAFFPIPKPKDYISLHLGIMAVQATLIAIVYPLSIALIGILLQVRSVADHRLSVFLRETEALPTGISSLLLCGIIAFELMIVNQSTRMGAIFHILNCAWLIINIALLSFFLIRTLKYTHSTARQLLFYSYIVNVSWPIERRVMIASKHENNAIEYVYIPLHKSDPKKYQGNEKFAVEITSPECSENSNNTIKTLTRKKQVVDIRFSILSIVAADWVNQVNSIKNKDIKKKKSIFKLIFSPTYSKIYTQNVILASSSLPLNWAQKFLIRNAYKFRSPSLRPLPPTTGDLLKEQLVDLILSLEANRVQDFDEQLNKIKELYIFLFKIAEVRSKNQIFSYTQILNPFHVYGTPLGQSWSMQYCDLFKQVVHQLFQKPDFFVKCAYLSAHLYTGTRGFANPTDLIHITSAIPSFLIEKLNQWALMTYKAETRTSVTKGSGFRLSPQTLAVYDTALREFVEAWEYLANCFYIFTPRPSRQDWDELTDNYILLQYHLNDTIRMIGKNAWIGDTLAICWTTDILIRWHSRNKLSWGGSNKSFAIITGSITTELFKKPIAELDKKPFIKIKGFEITPQEIFNAAIENLWRDGQLYLIYILVRWTHDHGIESAAASAAKKILHAKFFDTASTEDLVPFSSMDLLASCLRIFTDGRFENGYANQINTLIKQINIDIQNPRVPSRIYSNYSIDIYTFISEQACVLLVLISSNSEKRTLSEELNSILHQAVFRGDIIIRNLKERMVKLKTSIDKIDINNDFLSFFSDPLNTLNLSDRKIIAHELIDNCINKLIKHRDEKILNAKIDQTRINEISMAASRTAFTQSTAQFPINLFQTLNTTPSSTQGKSQTWILDYERGRITDPIMADPSCNETEWWAETMSKYVALTIFQDIVSSSAINEILAETPEKWWETLKTQAATIEKARDKVILVIGNIPNPPWLNEWLYSYSGRSDCPPDFKIWHMPNAEKKSGHLCNINNICVYQVPIFLSCCYLIPLSLLKEVKFTEYSTNSFVSIEVENDPNDDPWRCLLKTTFTRELMLGIEKVIKIISSDGENI